MMSISTCERRLPFTFDCEVMPRDTTRDGWISTMPNCLIGSGADDARTLDEAVHMARIELDLIEEGQDGTEHVTDAEVRAIRKWIKANEK